MVPASLSRRLPVAPSETALHFTRHAHSHCLPLHGVVPLSQTFVSHFGSILGVSQGRTQASPPHIPVSLLQQGHSWWNTAWTFLARVW